MKKGTFLSHCSSQNSTLLNVNNKHESSVGELLDFFGYSWLVTTFFQKKLYRQNHGLTCEGSSWFRSAALDSS